MKSTYQSSTIYEYRKKRLIMNVFCSQFNYCPLIWVLGRNPPEKSAPDYKNNPIPGPNPDLSRRDFSGGIFS